MSKVDWSLAPEGATHKDVTPYGLWYKFDLENNVVCYWNTRAWQKSGTPKQYDDGSLDRMEERPKQPKPWSGPEDGLPPVGLKCMHGEEVVEILAHRAFKGHEHDPLLVVFATADDVSFSSPCCFRPIAREDQIAAEKRETAIRELMDIAQVDCRVTAARLVDAGFKREVV